METKEKTALIKSILEDKKGIDVTVLDLTNISSVTDAFVIASGTSNPHIKALSDYVEEGLGEKGIDPLRVEGYDSAKWILLDYGDVLVHIFSEEARQFYSLEWLWADAPKDEN